VPINRVYAVESKKVVLLLFLVGFSMSVLVGWTIFTNYWRDKIGSDLYALEAIGISVVIPIFIVIVALNNQSKKVRLFNSYRL
jgi:ABC-type nitrate/sulfonate/bicarbonate transport system permease component